MQKPLLDFSISQYLQKDGRVGDEAATLCATAYTVFLQVPVQIQHKLRTAGQRFSLLFLSLLSLLGHGLLLPPAAPVARVSKYL